MRSFTLLVALLSAFSAACVKAPIELKTAVARQAQEIQAVNETYQANITRLLAALEKSQLDYLQQAEDNLRSKYLFEGTIGEPAGPNADPELLAIRLKTENKILQFFNAKRTAVHEIFEKKRTEFLKLQVNINNIAKINSAMADYVDSVIRLRKAQDTFAQTLLSHVGTLDKALPIVGEVIDEVVRVTDEEVDKFAPAAPSKSTSANQQK